MFNFMRKKIRACIATCFSVAMIISNSIPAVAAPYGYDGSDYFREKALVEYITEKSVVLAMADVSSEDKAPEKENAISETVTYSEVSETEEIPYNTVKKLNKALAAGETSVVREGTPGKKVKSYKIKYVNGKEASREVISEYTEAQPIDKIVEYGDKDENTAATPNGNFNYKYVIECTATAYDLSPEENGGFGGMTATGVPLDKGVIAVDPKVIPLGSRVYIEAIDGSWSYGFAVAADTGGAIKGNKIDLCYRTRSECIQFGRRKCRVYVL